MTVVFALLAALCNALNVITQHTASIASPKKDAGRRLIVYLLRNPLWLFGWIALAGALLATSEPHGGRPFPDNHAWVAASATTVGTTAVLTLLAARGSPARRAALLGSATAVMWALVATFIKTTTESLSQFGVAGMLTHWPVYALTAAGLATELLQQATLHAGPLSVYRDVPSS